jgi:hypothetical protein
MALLCMSVEVRAQWAKPRAGCLERIVPIESTSAFARSRSIGEVAPAAMIDSNGASGLCRVLGVICIVSWLLP